jgi:hypothetical protein
MVFEPSAAPGERSAYLDWYRLQTEWSEDHSYDDPAVTTAKLSAWFTEMRRDFPNLNGPGAADAGDYRRATDYSIGRSVIYACFQWSEAESAYAIVRALAVRHGVGFFNVSADDGEFWFPPTDHAADTTAIPDLTLVLEGQQVFASPSVALIEAAVDWLNPSGGPGFLVLENLKGNYAQAGGGKEACTAEWREYSSTGFQHWVAGMPGRASDTNITIPGNGTHFSIKANEQLSNDNVKIILLAFADGKSRPADFVWRDITQELGG